MWFDVSAGFPRAESTGPLLRKVRAAPGFRFGAGASPPQADGERSRGGVPEDFLGTVPLARNHPRPQIDVYDLPNRYRKISGEP